jgi:hypothetical protein
MISAHHAQTDRAHNQTGCRRYDQGWDSDSSEPIPTKRETGGRDSQHGDREDTAIPNPGSERAYPIMCRGAGWRLSDLKALLTLANVHRPYALDERQHGPNIGVAEGVSVGGISVS